MASTSKTRLKETFIVSGLAGLLLLIQSLPAFKYFFFGENFTQLRYYRLASESLLRAAFSRVSGVFFNPGLFLSQIWWDFILPADPMVYHIRNFIFCAINLILFYRLLLKFVQSRPARILAVGLLAVSKIYLTIVGYINLLGISIILMTTLLVMLFWWRYLKARRMSDFLITLAIATFAIYSRDSGLSIIGILVAMVLAFEVKRNGLGSQLRYWAIRFAPFFLVAVSFLVVRSVVTTPFDMNNPNYAPRLSAFVAGRVVAGFAATAGNLSLTSPGAMGARGFSGLFARNWIVSELVLCAAFWVLIGYTLWRARSSWQRFLVPIVWIGISLAPYFLIRNHQVYYYQDPLVALFLLIAICLETATPRLLTIWFLALVLVGVNGFIANRRSYYDWQFTANQAEIVKPLVASLKANPPRSIIFFTSKEKVAFWNFAVGGPMVSQLLDSRDTRIYIWDRVAANDATKAQALKNQGSVLFDLDEGAQISLPNANAATEVSKTDPTEPKISADPNPIRICDNSGLGSTTISYTFTRQEAVEVRIGSPVGPLFTSSTAMGNAVTGKWVTDGTVFYLQDVSDGKQPDASNTLATVTVRTTNAGCR